MVPNITIRFLITMARVTIPFFVYDKFSYSFESPPIFEIGLQHLTHCT